MASQNPKQKYGTSIYKEGLEDWIHSELVKRPYDWLEDLEKKAAQDRFPVLTPASGAVLAFLASSWDPDFVLELGTGYGISLFWLISAVRKNTKIQTVDREAEFIQVAKEFFAKLEPNSDRVEFTNADCSEIAKEFLEPSSLDRKELMFVDCDKIRYPEILEMILEKGKTRNLRVIYDNVLWHGRIADPENQAPSDQAVRKLWSLTKNSKIEYTLFPVGDGILCFDFKQ
ncbi:O-methyltransferase [Leptospira dzoumogneensis]|uniref:Methyltransferase domain-containing protein n=1 Tax=Leptospira dzoumogneensis TaxID=2484904 RepID=A0A4Z1AZK5_9LEPT|nr:methyltransferase domain-containing protein [Leptospira dzoumogneensis]TGN03360.1 methyltransferase domain-containing protein [Leptospira dzoumogneensis]